MKQPLHKRWIVDRKGKRRRGTDESMWHSLESHSNAMLEYLEKSKSAPNYGINAEVHARMAAHWALALMGK